MRVVIASHSGGLRGGAERCVLELAAALRADGRVEPTVTVPIRGELSEALEQAQVPWRIAPTPTWLVDTSPAWPGDPLRALRRAKRGVTAVTEARRWSNTLRESKPDVVMSSTTTSPTPALASRRAGIPHVWWIHEFTTLAGQKRYALGEPLAQRLIGRLSSRVAVNSQAVARYYSPPIPPAKIRMIELGVDTPRVPPNCIDRDRLRVLMLGRKDPAKGCETAIRGVGLLRDKGIEVTLRLVGPSLADYAETLWYLARDLDVLDRVEFIEYVADPSEQIAWSNVMLTCSVDEGFGRVAVEALKSGRPVIGARAGATVELIDHERTGLLFEAGDAVDLAQVIGRAAGDRVLVETMSRNALAAGADRFTMEREVATFVDLFQEVRRG
ncbi:MAG TPA: glycosyltransferase family 4 protein [Acidimicrobiia bacterium]|nr:glycosyltransferase family 4 protein [Acidimicrobiia bacterium]